MPHVNYARGETRRFVFRREHGKITHYTWHKGKSESWKGCKRLLNQRHRTQDREALRRDVEDPVYLGHNRQRVLWIMT